MNYEDSDWGDDDWEDGSDDEVDTYACPECEQPVYEEADVCPYCGCVLEAGWREGGVAPWWSFGGALREWSPYWIFLGMAGVIAVLFTFMMLV